MASWEETEVKLSALAARQLFFIGGARRSGTTWLQQIIDSHPQASCKGEGLFAKHLYPLLESCMAQRSSALEAKNTTLFRHTGGYPLPVPEDVAFLAGSAILLALSRQAPGRDCLAYGEKTPENVFWFERFRSLFPRARFIGMARDPRDVITSAWFFFQKPRVAQVSDTELRKLAFIRAALPALGEGARAMLDFGDQHPGLFRLVTYERLRQQPEDELLGLFRFLGLSAEAATIRDCLERTAFAAATGGREAGEAEDGAFLRKGVVGDWRRALTPEMNDLILRELGWMFPRFGWSP